MMDTTHDPVTGAFAELPAFRAEGLAVGFDGRAVLADHLAASAMAQAEQVYLALGGFMAASGRTLEDLTANIEVCGMVVLEAWADLMIRTGQDWEPWVREAALRAVRAYAGRLRELMADASEGGRA